nr:cytochrome c oxidase subunit 3 [Mytilopsis leucophaeata]
MARTGYPVVGLSVWPVASACGLGATAYSAINFFHGGSFFWVWLWATLLLLSIGSWWGDVIYEGTYEGRHTMLVRKVFRLGFKMFIVSEIFFFVSFFWAWLYYGIGELSVNHLWPPRGITPIEFWKEPGLGLAILLSSGATANKAHSLVKLFNTTWASTERSLYFRNQGLWWFAWTIVLAFWFLQAQYHEYHLLPYSINSSSYGSCFFVLTGFHASHVLLGTGMLIVCFVRLFFCHFSKGHDTYYVKVTVWYWHFVDVVWIFVLGFVYAWCY